MDDEQTRSLIFTKHSKSSDGQLTDYEFEKQINASASKWQMVGFKFNKGLKAKKTFFVGMDNDKVFPPLPDEIHADSSQSQWKLEKLCSDYSVIILFRQDQDQETAEWSHIGEKQLQNANLT